MLHSTQFCQGCEKLGGCSTSTQVSEVGEVGEKGVPLLRSFLRVLRNKSNSAKFSWRGAEAVRLLYRRISWTLRREFIPFHSFP
jgi:hypothetical protein